jgi:hypothetical protein
MDIARREEKTIPNPGLIQAASVSHDYDVDFDGPEDEANPMNWPTWYKWVLIVVLSAMNTIAYIFYTSYLQYTVTNGHFIRNLATVLCLPAGPEILKDLHTSDPLYITIIASVWELGEAAGALLTAPLSEIFGRAPVYNKLGYADRIPTPEWDGRCIYFTQC